MDTNNRILFLLKMPPPFTGATYMNSLVYKNPVFSKRFSLSKISISYAASVKDLGKFQLRKITVFVKTAVALAGQLLVKRPHFVYFQPSILGTTYFRDLILILIGRFFGVRYVLHLHGKGIFEAAHKNKVNLFLYKLGIKNQVVIVLSHHQKRDVEFLRPRRIFVVSNGTELLSHKETTIKVQRNPVFGFLFLSNLLKSKGVFLLLDAAARLNQKGHTFRLDLVGSEGDIKEEELQKKIDENNLAEIVFFHGPKYGSGKITYFENADAFVFPTQNDAFGLVILEAMQFSLPVIATGEGAIPEIIEHELSGYIYEKDSDGLFNYMEQLINQPELAPVMGKKGREIFFEKFTTATFEANMLSVFNETIKDLKQKI